MLKRISSLGKEYALIATTTQANEAISQVVVSSSGSVFFWTPLVDLWETYVVEPFSAPLSNTTCPYSGLKEGAPFGALFLVPS